MIDRLIDSGLLQAVAPRANKTAKIMKRLTDYLSSPSPRKPLKDEEVWTLLFVYGFVAAPDWNPDDARLSLARCLLGEEVPRIIGTSASLLLWPESPRDQDSDETEGESEIDLLLGDAALRDGTTAGVALCRTNHPAWICMVEAKWLSDISCQTTRDPHRNQLVRVIENGLVFQNQDENPPWPEKVWVSLLTPNCFRGAESRLYTYKYREYQNQTNILKDIDSARIGRRADCPRWRYPDLSERLKCFQLRWATFEELFEAMPRSAFKSALAELIQQAAGGLLAL